MAVGLQIPQLLFLACALPCQLALTTQLHIPRPAAKHKRHASRLRQGVTDGRSGKWPAQPGQKAMFDDGPERVL